MKTVLLNQIADVVMGQSPKSEFYNSDQQGLPFLQGCTTFGSKYPYFDTWTTNWKKEAEPGDILFTVRAPVGDMNVAQEKIAIGRGIAAIRPTNVSLEYLYFLLQYNVKHFISKSNGAVYDSINSETLQNIKLDVYDTKKVQDKVASILSAYDDLIENNNKRIKILESMAQELYKEWFVRFRFHGYKAVKFVDGIPEGWNGGRIEDIGSFSRGKNITSDEMEEGNIPVISAGINPSGFHQKSNVKGCSITISSSGANAGFMRINYSDIWAADCSYASEIDDIFYMYELLNNIRPNIDNLQRGAAQPHVYAKDVNRLKVILPPKELRTSFNKYAKDIHSLIAALCIENTNLAKQRDLLLPRLMSGKLEIKGIPDA